MIMQFAVCLRNNIVLSLRQGKIIFSHLKIFFLKLVFPNLFFSFLLVHVSLFTMPRALVIN